MPRKMVFRHICPHSVSKVIFRIRELQCPGGVYYNKYAGGRGGIKAMANNC